jgi:hypothetical protein
MSESGVPASMIIPDRSGLTAAKAPAAFRALALSISITSGQCAPNAAAAQR